MRRRRRLGQALALVDERLRVAVTRRDEALAQLGQASLGEIRGGERVRGFADTLTQLDANLAAAEAARDAAASERRAADAERRDASARYEMRLDALRAAQAPVSSDLDRARKHLSRQQDRAAELEKALLALSAPAPSPTPIPEPPTADGGPIPAAEAPPSDPPSQGEADRHAEAERALAALQPTLASATAACLALEAERDRLDAERTQLKAERDEALASIDAALVDLRAEEARAQQRLARLQARRRAVLMDLGHEVLSVFPDDPGAAHQEAREALEHIKRLQGERSGLDRDRADIDLAPVYRTVIVGLGAVIAGLLLWALF